METSQHTPGPWTHTSHQISPGKSWEIMAGPEKTVAMAYWSDADARLIAAAPDLLLAAEEVLEWLGRNGLAHTAHERLLRDAVIKATGGKVSRP